MREHAVYAEHADILNADKQERNPSHNERRKVAISNKEVFSSLVKSKCETILLTEKPIKELMDNQSPYRDLIILKQSRFSVIHTGSCG